MEFVEHENDRPEPMAQELVIADAEAWRPSWASDAVASSGAAPARAALTEDAAIPSERTRSA